jgi:hypothetical protein
LAFNLCFLILFGDADMASSFAISK